MILIISDLSDKSTFDVISILEASNAPYILITKEIQFEVFINVKYNYISFHSSDGIMFDLNQIKVVWYRRGYVNIKNHIFINKDEKNKAKHFTSNLQSEKIKIFDFINFKIEKINSIGKFSHNQINKLEILDIAHQLGLEIPNTIVTNSKKERVYPIFAKKSLKT